MPSPLRALFNRNFREPAGVLVNAFRRPDRAAARALALVQLGDTLSLARPPGWPHRARRAYVKAARILGPVTEGEAVGTLRAAALQARAFADGRRKPVKRAAIRLGAAISVAMATLFALLCIAFPGVRAFVAPNDLAKNASWAASSNASGFHPHGFGPRGDPSFFTTASEARPWLRVDLPRAAQISGIRVDNCTDCSEEKVLPLNVEILDGSHFRLVCQRRSPYSSFTCRFPPVRTGAVRVTLAGYGVFHLSRIAVYE